MAESTQMTQEPITAPPANPEVPPIQTPAPNTPVTPTVQNPPPVTPHVTPHVTQPVQTQPVQPDPQKVAAQLKVDMESLTNAVDEAYGRIR